MVEVIGAAIFGSLFLFELITGAANVPGFREYAYKGVVWIVLYYQVGCGCDLFLPCNVSQCNNVCCIDRHEQRTSTDLV